MQPYGLRQSSQPYEDFDKFEARWKGQGYHHRKHKRRDHRRPRKRARQQARQEIQRG